MSNETPKEFSSFMTPDSFRKTLQMLKSFYDNHTKKNCGYEDINGSQYSGVVENFGSELLLETRKLLMDSPSLKNVFIDNTLDFYFDIQYSDLIDTYDQQSLLVALLSKDVLLSNKEYRIRFVNCSTKYVLRAESWSDPVVHRDTFIYTTTPPTLIITDKKDKTNIEEVVLKLSDESDISTDYYFFKNKATQDIIDKYDEVNGELITIPLDDSIAEQPLIWMCVDILKLLPNISFINNKDINGKELLSIGTDGHDVTRLYPYVYEDNIPIKETTESSEWFIKVHAVDNESFVNSMNSTNNYMTAVGDISFVNCTTMGEQPIYEQTITFDHKYVEMLLSKEVEWSFKTPVKGDYDYDGMTYINPCYAYIRLNEFVNNINESEEHRVDLISAFIVKFDDAYLHKFESICNNAVSGIHIDASSEYSDNSIDKKNGVIHDLGDFDGLPKYFSYLLDRTIHRIHTELYSIRDDLNNKNQHATDKQTAALILDSAIPQNEINYITDNLNMVITYSDNRTYVTSDESVSPSNSLSELTLVDVNTFGNVNLPGNDGLDKFIYYGNRVFSVGLLELDPELEVSRVYYINNDTIDYENNDLTKFKKSARSLCRICDIPTSFVQLINIEGTSPTLVIDEKYIRTEVSFTDEDNNELWNNKHPRLVTKKNDSGVVTLIFDVDSNLDNTIGTKYLTEHYHSTINQNNSINLYNSSKCKLSVSNSGSGYSIGDEFKFIIGGLCFKGTITSSEESDDSVLDFQYEPTNIDDIRYQYINISNLDGYVTTLKTTTTSGGGNGLTLLLTINIDYWKSLQPKSGGILSGLYCLKFDKFANVWAWEYDIPTGKWIQKCQLTGTPVIENDYDDIETQTDRKLSQVFIKNILSSNNIIDNTKWISDMSNSSCLDINNKTSSVPKDVDISTTEDLSSFITKINEQDRYYVLTENGSDESQYHDVICIDRYPVTKNESINRYTFPRFHGMNLSDYHNKSNMLSYSFTDTQPIISYYNPFANEIYNFEKITNDVYEVSNHRTLTFADIILKKNDYDNIDSNIINTETGVLLRNVYRYSEYDMNPEIISFIDEIKSLSREELVSYINENISVNAYPLRFEGTEYAYTEQMFIDYIIENIYTSPVYKKNDIYLMREKGQQVIEKSNDTYTGVGEQPTGLYLPISTTNVDTKTYVNGNYKPTETVFIFKLDCDPGEFGSIDDYTITDDSGNDITEKSILVYNNSIYVYTKDSGWNIIINN